MLMLSDSSILSAMNDEKKSPEILEAELAQAAKMVPMGSYYTHYKHPDDEHQYKIVGYVVLEATDEVAILYQALYIKQQIVFCRALRIWQETVTWEGKTVPRFSRAG
jgi:hypothetical protein